MLAFVIVLLTMEAQLSNMVHGHLVPGFFGPSEDSRIFLENGNLVSPHYILDHNSLLLLYLYYISALLFIPWTHYSCGVFASYLLVDGP